MIRAQVFDIGNVVCAFEPDRRLHALARLTGLAGVDALFERVVYSRQIKRQKPDPVAFERLCAELQRPPEELLFVDDSPANVEGARSAGLAAVVFTSERELVADLERHGVLG